VTHAGLTAAEAEKRLAEFGHNELPEDPPPGRATLLIRQFLSPMIGLLALAAAVSLLAGDALDAVVILAIVVLNACIGYVQEGRADDAAREVRQLLAHRAHVLRDGRTLEVAAEDVVPGDLLTLAAGDRIAADGTWLDVAGVEVNESILTGESLPVTKAPNEHAAAGTVLTRGSGRVVVNETGPRTKIGRIVRTASQAPVQTPLQERLGRLTVTLLWAVGLVCVALAVVEWAHGASVRDSFQTGVALAVAAVPEALPAVVTIALALGLRRLSLRGAIIRRLPAVETLGSATVICTDKTGTLTENSLSLDCVWDVQSHREHPPSGPLLGPALLASDPFQSGGEQSDPVESAIAKAASGADLTRADALGDGQVSGCEPFDPTRRLMKVSVQRAGTETVYVKGAPEAVLARLADRSLAAEMTSITERWANQGARVLVVASERKGRLFPLSLLRLVDPPRATARASLDEARAAGVRTLMVTGDHPGTALAVARATGVEPREGPVPVLSGADIELLDDAALTSALEDTNVFARVAPEQKLRLVRLLAGRGEVVAMTGDGVNDVPALRAAHIGIAMGRSGSDAAAAASDMVLADDDYSTIVRAIRVGRTIFDDIRHFTLFLLAANLGEVLLFAIAVGAGLSAPLTVLQILLVNLLTDGLPAVALAADPPERGVMRRPPRPLREGLLYGAWGRLAVAGITVALASFSAYLIGRGDGLDVARTLAFGTLVVGQLLFVYSARTPGPFWRASRNRSLDLSVALSLVVGLAVLALPPMREVFTTAAISGEQVLAMLALATTPLLASELHKALAGMRPSHAEREEHTHEHRDRVA
jgi:Ca2+-transporting ATPase